MRKLLPDDMGWGLLCRAVCVAAAVAAASCSGSGPKAATSGRDGDRSVCDALTSERELVFPGPDAPDNLAEALDFVFGGSAPGEPVAVFAFVVPTAAAELDAVVAMVGGLDGVEVVDVLGQSEAYEEFSRMFADNPDLVASATADLMPPKIELTADNDASFDALRAALESDPRIRNVVDDRATVDGAIARAFVVNTAYEGELQVLAAAADEAARDVAARTTRLQPEGTDVQDSDLQDDQRTVRALLQRLAETCGFEPPG